jgi:hypothetical protein
LPFLPGHGIQDIDLVVVENSYPELMNRQSTDSIRETGCSGGILTC